MVINKYIGETGKNHRRMLGRAAVSEIILFLDEADALLGTRREVKDTRDRHSNTKTNHLHQEMEKHGGMVILTTNPLENIGQRLRW